MRRRPNEPTDDFVIALGSNSNLDEFLRSRKKTVMRYSREANGMVPDDQISSRLLIQSTEYV